MPGLNEKDKTKTPGEDAEHPICEIKEQEEPKGPTEQEIVELKAEELIEEEKKVLRIKAQAWAEAKAEERANQKALVIANEEKELSLEVKTFNDLRTMVKYYAEGQALPKALSEAQAMMVIQMGKQMNMTMFEALQGIGYVNGKMIIYGEIMIGQLTKSGYKIKFLESNEKVCKVTIKGNNGEITEEFKIEQAQKAGWVKAYGPWHDQPHLMLRYKAIRQGMKFLCPEVMSGLTTYEEAVTEITEEKETVKEGDIEINITNKFKKND